MMKRWLALVLGALALLAATPRIRGTQHDFDFEFGRWKAVLHVRQPLSPANHWTTYAGTSVVTPIWNGRANYGILDVRHGRTRLLALTLRLFEPQSHQWHVRFSNSADGKLGVAAVGGFNNGVGVFYDTEPLNGKMVNVRFVFSDITKTSFRFEQSYSDDGGARWIVNWDATFTRPS